MSIIINACSKDELISYTDFTSIQYLNVLSGTMPIGSDDQGLIVINNYDALKTSNFILINSEEEFSKQLVAYNYKTSIDVDFNKFVLVGFCGKSSYDCENKEFIINALISEDSQIIKFQVVNRLFGNYEILSNRPVSELHWVLISKELKDFEIIIEEKIENVQSIMDLDMIKGVFGGTIQTANNSQVIKVDCNVLIDRMPSNNTDVHIIVNTEQSQFEVYSEYITKFNDKIILEGNLLPYGRPKYEGDFRLYRCIFVQSSNAFELVFYGVDSNVYYLINGEKVIEK